MVALPHNEYLRSVSGPREMDKLEEVMMKDMEALAHEAISEPESVLNHLPERRNWVRFGERCIIVYECLG